MWSGFNNAVVTKNLIFDPPTPTSKKNLLKNVANTIKREENMGQKLTKIPPTFFLDPAQKQ